MIDARRFLFIDLHLYSFFFVFLILYSTREILVRIGGDQGGYSNEPRPC